MQTNNIFKSTYFLILELYTPLNDPMFVESNHKI